MAKYVVRYQEVYSADVVVEADNRYEAKEKVLMAFADGVIQFDKVEDFYSGDVEYVKESNGKDEDWYHYL